MKLPALPLLLLLTCLLGWANCVKDDDDDPVSATTTLNYDGPNFTAPQLPPGTNTFAAYFPPSETERLRGGTLDKITFYLTRIPQSTSVVIYADGPSDRTPGTELYRRDITGRTTTTEWNEHLLLGDAIELIGQGLWLAIEVELGQGEDPRSVGCDAGRSYSPNGDRLLLSIDSDWTSFNELNGETVNWNIRGEVSGVP